MAALNSKFDILRGWPNSSAVAEDFVIGGTSTHAHKAGTWVKLAATTDGTMQTDDDNASSSASTSCFLVIEGRDDLSSRFANRVTCLVGGGYVVRIPETYRDSDNVEVRCIKSGEFVNCTVGVKVKVDTNVLTPATVTGFDANNNNALDQSADIAIIEDRSAVVGLVIAHNATDNTIDVYVH